MNTGNKVICIDKKSSSVNTAFHIKQYTLFLNTFLINKQLDLFVKIYKTPTMI